MTKEEIELAEAEAKRFLARCKAAKEAFTFRKFNDGSGGYWSNENTVATAALRRSSMDLSRALSAMRRPHR